MMWCDEGLDSQLKEKKVPTHSLVSIATHSAQEAVSVYVSEKEPYPRRQIETSTTAPKKSSLWDEAYDILKEENPTLVTEYEELLLRLEDESMWQPITLDDPGS